MKRVKLIRLKTKDIEVIEHEDSILLPAGVKMTSIAGSGDRVHEFYNEDEVPIHKIVDHNIEHYIAVENKVWEYLYLIENPVTAKAQEAKIKSLTEKCDRWFNCVAKLRGEFNDLRCTMLNASLLTRIKWVFTGVKF